MSILIFLIIFQTESFSESLLQKANEYYSNNEYKHAIRTYYEALENGENPALIYFNLANTYYQKDSVAKAIVCYKSSIFEAPKFFRAYLNLGILYYNLDDMAQTATTLEKALQIKPEHTQTMLILSSAYKGLQEYSLSIPLMEKILEIDPKKDECYFLLYEINYEIGDLIEAKNWLEKYPKDGKRVTDKLQLLAELSEETEDLEEAIFFYNQLISCAPEQKWSYYHLVRITYLNGTPLSALQQAELALSQFTDFGDLALMAGNIAFENKFFPKAENFYTIAYKTGKSGGLVGLQNLLRSYQLQGDNDNINRINDKIISSRL